MGETAVFLALLTAVCLVALLGYRFRNPRHYNAREMVRAHVGAPPPEDKIE